MNTTQTATTQTAGTGLPAYSTSFEQADGARLTTVLERLPRRFDPMAFALAQELREAYPGQCEDAPSYTVAERSLQAALGRLTPERRNYWFTLATFAMHETMKHHEDEGYFGHLDHHWEDLVHEDADGANADDFERIATELNAERWEEACVTAISHALAEQPRPARMKP